MEHLFVVVLFLSVIFLAFIVEKQSKHIREIDSLNLNKIDEYYEQQYKAAERGLREKLQLKEDNLEKEWQHAFQKHSMELSTLGNEIKKYESILKEKEARYNEVNQDLDLYKQGKIKEIDSAAAEYEQRKRLLIDASIVQYRELRENLYNGELDAMKARRDSLSQEISDIKSELEVERRKRAAINEEIRKEEEKERYVESHSVQLTDDEKEDIHFLLSLEDKIHNKQVLYKLVWSTYLQQAYKNTFHNILGNKDPKNVIYCIENINTGKKYIGKTSAEISKRWTEHIKTSLNIGTIKTTNIHKALYNHWDEFIFYIIEETTKEKLSEMEKYYINFYESDKYGYNIKAGG